MCLCDRITPFPVAAVAFSLGEPPAFFLFCLPCLFTFLPTYWGDILESDVFIGLCRWWCVSSSRRPFFSNNFSVFWFLFFQCVNRPVRSVVCGFYFILCFFFWFCFCSFSSFLFLLMLSGRFDTAGRDYGLKKKLSGLWELSFLDYFSCCSWLTSTAVA